MVGGNFVKQDADQLGRSRHLDCSRRPIPTSCLDGGCCSGTPLGRFIVLANDRILRGPVIGRPGVQPAGAQRSWPISSDFTTADRFNFAPFNFILTPLERYGGFVTAKQELGENMNLSAKVVCNRRNSKNQAAPLPLFVGPDAGNGNLLDTIVIDASNPFNPFGQTLGPGTYNFIGRRWSKAGRGAITRRSKRPTER